MALRIELFPADLDRFVDFYTRVLRFQIVADQRPEGGPYVALHRGSARIGAAKAWKPVDPQARAIPQGVELVPPSAAWAIVANPSPSLRNGRRSPSSLLASHRVNLDNFASGERPHLFRCDFRRFSHLGEARAIEEVRWLGRTHQRRGVRAIANLRMSTRVRLASTHAPIEA
jgi:hypothetical protein